MKWLIFTISIFLFSCNMPSNPENDKEPTGDWEILFNEKNLDNWEVKNGTAEYRIEGDEIVGTSKVNTPNTFLCTKKMYENFILELELKVDTPLNSGIQIRSNSLPDYQDGRVHGYQVEIDPSPRAFSGGIYDEGRRGWIYPLCENQAGRKGFKNGEWNHYRIEAIGSAIRVWVNGIQTANLQDDLTAKGFIGLQVHSIGKNPALIDKTVRWRNIKIITNNLQKYQRPDDGKAPEINLVSNLLSEREKKDGYKLVMAAKDSVLVTSGESVEVAKVKNFELKFEFNFAANAEGGIQYFSDGKGGDFVFQIMDNNTLPKKEKDENLSLASLKGKLASQNLCVSGRQKDFRGLGNWNTGRIKVRNGTIEHWMNGFKMVEAKISELGVNWEESQYQILLKSERGEIKFQSIKLSAF